MNQKILEKIAKVKTLSESGVGGERDAANRALASLMNKYSLSDSDIDRLGVKVYDFRYKTDLEYKLISQIAVSVLGANTKGIKYGRKKLIGFECNPNQFYEIYLKYDTYKKAMEKDLEVFFVAFVHKNNIFSESQTSDEKLTDDQRSSANKALSMMDGMDFTEIRKRIK